MKPAISQVCTLHTPFQQDLEDYSAGACRHVELWLGKLETYLDQHTPSDVIALLAEQEISAPVASYQGGLLLSQGDARREHWAHFAKRLELCAALNVETLVLVGDISGPLSEQDLQRVQVSLVQAAQQALPFGVRLAFEFQAKAAFANNLQTAAALVEACGATNLGLCLDVFHFFHGPSKTEDLNYLTTENLFHVQFCDCLGCTRELATDADRILPGDGDFLLQPVVERLTQINYQGLVALELMNPAIWKISPRQVGEVGLTALRKTLGQAHMGA